MALPTVNSQRNSFLNWDCRCMPRSGLANRRLGRLYLWAEGGSSAVTKTFVPGQSQTSLTISFSIANFPMAPALKSFAISTHSLPNEIYEMKNCTCDGLEGFRGEIHGTEPNLGIGS